MQARLGFCMELFDDFDVLSISLDWSTQEYSQKVAAALDFNAKLRASLRSVELKTSFYTDNKDLTKQLREVARLIATSASAWLSLT